MGYSTLERQPQYSDYAIAPPYSVWSHHEITFCILFAGMGRPHHHFKLGTQNLLCRRQLICKRYPYSRLSKSFQNKASNLLWNIFQYSIVWYLSIQKPKRYCLTACNTTYSWIKLHT